jgi:endonuclease YncB( thermonuclease family)
MKYLFILLLLFAGCGDDDSIKVIGITDGDTIKILQNNQEYKVRLSEIDCPERKQPFHTQAKNLTSKLAFGKNVTITNGGFDRYKRLLAEVRLPDGKSLNQELVRAGMAWEYKQYSKNPIYAQLESEARQAKRGLWADKEPVPPWEFRKKKSAKTR